jgi:hypothetical protein
MSSSSAERRSSWPSFGKVSLNETVPQFYGPNLHTRPVQNA